MRVRWKSALCWDFLFGCEFIGSRACGECEERSVSVFLEQDGGEDRKVHGILEILQRRAG